MTNYNDYHNESNQYGKLTPAQSSEVEQQKQIVEQAKNEVVSYIGVVSHTIKLERKAQVIQVNQIGSELVQSIDSKMEDKHLSPAQKKILSNVQENIEDLKKSKAGVEKEINNFEIERAKAQIQMSKDLGKLKGSAKKVDSLKTSGRLRNTLFRQDRGTRVEKAKIKAGSAVEKKEKQQVIVTSLTTQQKVLSSKISDLQAHESELMKTLDKRLCTAKEVHEAIAKAEKQYKTLESNYEAKKEEFANSKTASKLNSGDKDAIKSELASLKNQIKNLNALEKKIGNEKIDKDNDSKLIEASNKQLQFIEFQISQTSKRAQVALNNAKPAKMNVFDRLRNTLDPTRMMGLRSDGTKVDIKQEPEPFLRNPNLQALYETYSSLKEEEIPVSVTTETGVFDDAKKKTRAYIFKEVRTSEISFLGQLVTYLTKIEHDPKLGTESEVYKNYTNMALATVELCKKLEVITQSDLSDDQKIMGYVNAFRSPEFLSYKESLEACVKLIEDSQSQVSMSDIEGIAPAQRIVKHSNLTNALLEAIPPSTPEYQEVVQHKLRYAAMTGKN